MFEVEQHEIKYSIDTPHSVKDIANTFKKSLKVKIKLTWGIKLENAEKKKKPSDIDLVFFPVVSRTGTDIDAALSKITHSKPVIIVVLHHTFDPNAVVSNSSTFVKRDNTLTVDCLFYEDKGLLKCKRNDKAFEDAIQWLKLMKKVVKEQSSRIQLIIGKLDSTESAQVGEGGGEGIRKDLELGHFQGSPEAQPHYMHKAVGSNILGSPSVEITFCVPRGKKK
ncbi:uncharacterized protein [Sinocyclocheilus grahami]|uniref:uncharacterized protein isoform X2 n=1 Tax=Sinocyclocheilus grahami TaxID=75366 RepID=UPI0007AD14C3|nr:PREDICTED: uncharacterized protein LOC107596116 isoform X2 [Sinocyclocheilus grahami]